MKRDNPFGGPVHWKASTGSTMEDALDLWKGRCPSGTVAGADHQTAGRGRFEDRDWRDEPGSSLLFTLVLDPQDPRRRAPGALSLIWASALARTWKAHGLESRVKWPNDVLVNGGKTAGILVQGRGGALLSGIGVNVGQGSFPFPTRTPATSLVREGWSIDTQDLLAEVLEALWGAWTDPTPLPERLDPWLHQRGEATTLRTIDQGGERIVEGVLEGIGLEGQALIRTSRGLEEIFSGE